MSFGLRAILPAIVVSLSLGAHARADSLSCDGRIVASGDSTYRVRSVCGAPAEENHRVETRTVKRRVTVPCATEGKGRCSAVVEDSVEVVIDEWTYDFGRHRFLQHLTFEQGKLARIEAGSYGAQ
jgi:hypothetical protein